jgi:hypothetical protein
MKKRRFMLVAIVSAFLALLAIAAASSSVPLKGKWKGSFRTVTAVGGLGGDFVSSLEILNDEAPFKGEFLVELPPRWGTVIKKFENGNFEGRLFSVIWDDSRWIKLELSDDGKKLSGQYSWDNTLANLTFRKK